MSIEKLPLNSTQRLADTVFPIRRGVEPISLIVLPDLGGNVLYARKIVSHLQFSGDVYGMRLDVTLLEDLPQMSLTAMAERFANDLSTSGLSRPLHLLGYSFAGFLAFETAYHLARCGAEVGMVTLLDFTLPPRFYPPGTIRCRRLILDEARNAKFQLEQLMGRAFDRVSQPNRRQILYEPGFLRMDLSKHPEPYRQLIRHLYRSMIEYRPNFFENSITLIRARDDIWFAEAPSDLGWGNFVRRKVDVEFVGGDHLDMVRDDAVTAQVAQILHDRIKSY